MIEPGEEEAVAGGDEGGEMLLYDYFKHLTSLCLITLGGALALADKTRGTSSGLLIGALVVVGLAAATAFSGASEIVGARTRQRAPNHLNLYRAAAPILLSIGIGMFLFLFIRTLKA